MRDIMVDLETLGQTPGCIILSIGAVAFDPHSAELDPDPYYAVVNKRSCMDVFLSEDESTVKWWQRQNDEAKKLLDLVEITEESVSIGLALQGLNSYVKNHGGFKQARVWGNGGDFDNAILAAAHAACDSKPSWAFWNNRCYRTLKSLAPSHKLERQGTYHNALDDAISQARHMQEIVKLLAIQL